MPGNDRTTDGQHSVPRYTLALCCIFHIRCGGEHPPNFNVVIVTECEACRRWHGTDA